MFLGGLGDTTPAFQAKLLRVLRSRVLSVGAELARRCEAPGHRGDASARWSSLWRTADSEGSLLSTARRRNHRPPLRDRSGDVPALAEHQLRIAARDAIAPPLRFSDGALRRLRAHTWPGNVRELENAVRRAVVDAPGRIVEEEDLALGAATSSAPTRATPAATVNRTLAAVERAHLEQVLRECGGNKRRASRALGLTRPRLDRLLGDTASG